MRQSPFSTLLLFTAIGLIGAILLWKIPFTLHPDYYLPKVYINTFYSGASPLQTERELTAPIEAELAKLSELTEIRSVSEYENSLIILEFDKEADIDYKRLEVRSYLRSLKDKLPDNVDFPLISLSQNQGIHADILLIYSFHAHENTEKMAQIIQPLITNELALLKGVSELSFSGISPAHLKIELNLQALKRYSISIEEIKNILNTLDESISVGFVHQRGQRGFLEIKTQENNLEKLDFLAIKNVNGRILRLRDLAEWEIAPLRPNNYFRINGKQSLTLSIKASKEANLIELAKNIKNQISKVQQQLPPGYELRLRKDESLFLEKELKKLSFRTVVSLVLLSIVLLVLTFDGSYTVILLISLISNLSLVVLLFYLLGLSFNLYSLAGITVAFGIMIDNSILMIEALKTKGRFLDTFLPIFAATITSLASLLCVYFLPESYKIQLYDFCYAIAISLLGSLLVAFALIPALVQYIQPKTLKTKKEEKFTWQGKIKALAQQKTLRFYRILYRMKRFMFVGIILLFGIPVYLLPAELEGDSMLSSLYNRTIGTDLYQEKFEPYVEKCLGGLSRLFYRYNFSNSQFQKLGRTRIQIIASAPNGMTAEQLNALFIHFEKLMGEYETYLDTYETHIYSGQLGIMNISFKEIAEHSVIPFRLIAKVEELAVEFGGIAWTIGGVGVGFRSFIGQARSYDLKLTGYDYQVLDTIAQKLAKRLTSNYRVEDLNIDEDLSQSGKELKVYNLNFHQEKLVRHGLSVNAILPYLQSLSNEELPSGYINFNIASNKTQSVPIVVKQIGYASANIKDLMKNPVGLQGYKINLDAVSDIEETFAQNNIYKENQQYLRVISYNYNGSKHFGNQYIEKVLKEINQELPHGYKIDIIQKLAKAGSQYQGLILGIILVLIFIICSILFESLIYPLIIISIIPMAYIGVFIAFYVFDIGFDSGAFASFILLAGLTVNNSIVLMYYIKQLEQKSLPSILHVLQRKALPIFLGVFSTCVSLAPMLIGKNQEVFWYPFAIGAISGLLVSTLLLFIYIPLYFRLS